MIGNTSTPLKKKLFSLIRHRLYGPFLFFTLLSFVLLYKPLLTPGTFLGGDWSLPYTSTQFAVAAQNYSSSWLELSSLVGNYQSYLTDVLFIIPYYTAAMLGLSGATVSKLYLFLVYILAGASMYRLLRSLALSLPTALTGGALYVTSPFIFNYTIMGWINVLFAMALFPLFIHYVLQSFTQKSVRSSVIAGLIWTIAMVQSTAIFWYAAGVGACLLGTVRSKKRAAWAIGMSLFMLLMVSLFHAHWIINLVRTPDPIIYGSANVLSGISLGTWAKLSLTNLIKGWGSLFNYSYEYSYLGWLRFLSFILPALALGALLSKKKGGPPRIPFVILYLIPFCMYLAGPATISLLPFSNIIRDVARMTVLISFSLVVLASYTIERLLHTRGPALKGIVLALLFLSINPFWRGELWGEKQHEEDIRLRNYVAKEEILNAERYLHEQEGPFKVLYFPFGQATNDYSQERFRGAYNEVATVFSTYARHPGRIATTDKNTGGLNAFYTHLQNTMRSGSAAEINAFLDLLNTHYLVFSHDRMGPSDWHALQTIQALPGTESVIDEERVSVFKRNTDTSEVSSSAYIVYAALGQENVAHVQTLLDTTTPFSLFEAPEYYQTEILPEQTLHPLTTIADTTWHPGWSWPTPTHAQGTIGYRMMILFETIREVTARDPISKIDHTLWHTAKRAQEAAHVGSPSTNKDRFEKQKEVLFKRLNAVPDEQRDAEYYNMLIKTHHYLQRIAAEYGYTEAAATFSGWVTAQEASIAAHLETLRSVRDEALVTTAELLPVQETITTQLTTPAQVIVDSASSAFTPLSFTQIGQLILTNDHPLRGRLVELVEQAAEKENGNEVPLIYRHTSPITAHGQTHTFSLAVQEPAIVLITQDIETIADPYLPRKKEANVVTREVVTAIEEVTPATLYTREIRPEHNTAALHVYLFSTATNPVESVRLTTPRKEATARILRTDTFTHAPTLTTTKEHATRYRVHATDVDGPFGLILRQRYHPGWEIVSDHEITVPTHAVADGYANGWVIDPGTETGALTFTIEFTPQRTTRIGGIISILTLITTLFYLIRTRQPSVS